MNLVEDEKRMNIPRFELRLRKEKEEATLKKKARKAAKLAA